MSTSSNTLRKTENNQGHTVTLFTGR